MNNSTMIKKLSIFTFGLAFASLAAVDSAQALTFISTSSGQIGTVDTSTGAFTQIGSPGTTFFDIALSNSNNLFGGSNGSALHSINQISGTSSFIGNFGAFINGLGFSTSNTLYGTGGNSFYTINTATGAATLVSNIAGFGSSGDIVFDPVNNRFLATSAGAGDSLWSIALDGTGTQIGNIGFSGVYGLTFELGTLFGYTSNNKQLVINLATGAGTFSKNVTGINGQTYGTASLPSTGPVNSVPEPASTIGLLTLATIGVGSVLKRNQQKLKV